MESPRLRIRDPPNQNTCKINGKKTRTDPPPLNTESIIFSFGRVATWKITSWNTYCLPFSCSSKWQCLQDKSRNLFDINLWTIATFPREIYNHRTKYRLTRHSSPFFLSLVFLIFCFCFCFFSLSRKSDEATASSASMVFTALNIVHSFQWM